MNKYTFLLFFILLVSCKDQANSPVLIECGGPAQFACPRGMFCNLNKDCGGIDRFGQCKVQPVHCPIEEKVFCGCDKQEYASVCYANANGVTVAYEGPCISE